MPAASSTDLENQPPVDPKHGVTSTTSTSIAKRAPSRSGDEKSPLKEVAADKSLLPEDVPFSEAVAAEAAAAASHAKASGKKCSSGQMSFSSKILLCGSGSGQERESKRKEVDENNPSAQNPPDASCIIRSRKSSRKGSKKKSKDTIPMSSLDPAKEEAAEAGPEDGSAGADQTDGKDPVTGKTSQNSNNKSCCFCWCCCCSCSW